jgi:putative ABC transport system ATP-binding protein
VDGDQRTGSAVVGRGLRKSYEQAGGRLQVLDGVDVEVGRGEFVATMGPSGSGKSTLLHLLGGLDVADEGEVELDGQALSQLSDDGRARLRAERVGIVYQFFNLIPVLTAAENVALPALIGRVGPDRYRPRVDALLELVGLGPHADQLPSELSGGQQQRVAIARALFYDPAVVLADEPTGNLDLETGAAILDLFLRARAELDQALFMVTHDPRSAACADRVLLLRDGRVADHLDLRALPPGSPERTRRVLGLLSAAPGSLASVDGHHEPASERGAFRTRRRRAAPLRARSS